MLLYIAFDDTDNLTSPGTGHLLEDFRTFAARKNWGPTKRISRHQLFFHPDVPYTSHNSSMCFTIDTDKQLVDEIEKEAVSFLLKNASEGSDPGLCLLEEPNLRNEEQLLEYGYMAKSSLLNKKIAWETALDCGARLSEHGGTGDGIIGALAGVALRYGGNDGRFRGQLENLNPGEVFSISALTGHEGIEKVAVLEPGNDRNTMTPPNKKIDTVRLQDKPKTILHGGEAFFLVYQRGNHYVNWTRKELKAF